LAITRLRIRVGGNWYNVEVGDLDRSPVQVTVDGETFAVEVEGLAGQTPARPRRGRTQTPGILVPPPASRVNPTGGDGNFIRSPMPGRVISIMVRPGDTVSVGQEVCVVEAMKMQNELRAPCAGRVTAVNVSAGDSVASGDTLVVVE